MPMPPIAPLQTPRLCVREIRDDDLADLMAVSGDPEVTHFLPYATWQSADDARAWLGRVQALVAGGGACQLVMALHDGPVIGTVLLFRHDEGSRRAEIGYAMGRAHQGRGLAAEAVGAVVAHAFDGLGLHRLEAEVNPDNAPSAALLRRLGFVHEGRLRQRWTAKGRTYDVDAYGLLAPEWRAARNGGA